MTTESASTSICIHVGMTTMREYGPGNEATHQPWDYIYYGINWAETT